MASHTPIGERVRLADLIQRQEFQCLTSKQQAFLSRYISSGLLTGCYDAAAAVSSVYRTTPKNAVVMGHEILGNRRIKRVLDLHFCRNEIDSLMDDLGRAARLSISRDLKNGGSLSIATIKAVQLLKSHARQNSGAGIDVPDEAETQPDEPKKTFSVGDHVWQAGVEYVVAKLKTDGTIDDADPVEVENVR